MDSIAKILLRKTRASDAVAPRPASGELRASTMPAAPAKRAAAKPAAKAAVPAKKPAAKPAAKGAAARRR